MSNAIVPADTAVTITKPAKKLIHGINAETLAARVIPHAADTIVKPSDVKMSDATANAAMGGKLTPEGFMAALLFKTVRLAWGACRIEQATANLPEFAVFAIKEAHSRLMGTKGITAGELRAIAVHAFSATAELPVKTKAVKAETPSKVETLPADKAPDESPALIEETKRAERIHNARHMQALNEKAGILLDFQRMQERDQERENAKRNTVEYRVNAAREAIQAVDENTLRAMLAELGYELRRKPVKKAA